MHSWYQPDQSRTPWCVLDIATSESPDDGADYISEWGLGDGNTNHLAQVETRSVDSAGQEDELLEGLGEALDNRRYNNTTLVTPSRQTLTALRTRFLSANTELQTTFRGFQHVSVANLVAEYLDEGALDQSPPLYSLAQQNQEAVHSTKQWIRELWDWYVSLVPIVPKDAVLGGAL